MIHSLRNNLFHSHIVAAVRIFFTCILNISVCVSDSRESILTHVYHRFSEHIIVLILLSRDAAI